MKKLYFIFLASLVLNITSYNQAQNWQWAKSAGGTDGYETATCAAIDQSGNIYVTGSFESYNVVIGSTTLTNKGKKDIFFVKYDSNGNVVWAKSYGGNNDEVANSITVDKSGNVYITGSFESQNITFGTTTLTNNGKTDIFIVKYNSNGNVLWAKSVGNNDDEGVNDIALDKTGNIYITGEFKSSSIVFGTTTLTNNGMTDIFLTKYNSDGNIIWAKSVGGSEYENSNSVTVDASCNIYITGSFESNSIILGTDTLINNSYTYSFLLVKYDSAGNEIWGKSDREHYIGTCVTTDISSNVYVAMDSMVQPIGHPISIFSLIKYAPNGDILWIRDNTGGEIIYNTFNTSNNITTDISGNVYITGAFNDSVVIFGTDTLIRNAEKDNIGQSHSDFYFLKYDSSGNKMCAAKIGGDIDEEGICIIADKTDDIYILGNYQSNYVQIGTTTLINNGDSGTNSGHGGSIVYWRYSNFFLTKLHFDPTGINTTIIDNSIKLYPNPTDGIVNLEIESTTNQNIIIDIININGQLIYSKKFTHNTLEQIDISQHPKGMYFIKALVGDKMYVEKIIYP